ncbi:MAG: late competence development ComFB family protein [Treponema sp.]|jgi:competence protein ComFB|nr:late competence development ComFB family protein [Treponema sp.]
MEIHNVSEEVVFNSVNKIFEIIRKEGNKEGLCLCEQCKIDTMCYSLNRIMPHYIVSNRGMARMEQDWAGKQQVEADIAALVYKGLGVVNHNQRPTALHDETITENKVLTEPAFYIPTIIGRLFDGETFAPIAGVTVELRSNGELVPMRNRNWQNPFTLVTNTPGTYTFWPAPVPAHTLDVHGTFEYSLKIESPQYESLTHFFKIPAISSMLVAYSSVSMDRTFKLPDLYLFHPGEAEINGDK